MTSGSHPNDGSLCSSRREGAEVLEYPEELGGEGAIIGLDPGARHVGVAVSDPGRTVASPVGRIRRKSLRELADSLRKIIESRNAGAIIVGLPRKLSGARKARARSPHGPWRATLPRRSGCRLHCGTNASRPPRPSGPFWRTMYPAAAARN